MQSAANDDFGPAGTLMALSIGDKKLAELKQQYSLITFDTAIANTDGYLCLTRAIANLRDARGNLEERRKEVKQPYMDACRQIDDEAKRILGAIVEVETPLKSIKDKVDAEKARVKKEKEEAERKKVEEELRRQIAEENRIRAEAEAKRKAEEAAERERVRLEQEAQAAALASERAKLEEERKQVEADRAAAEEHRLAVEKMAAEVQARAEAVIESVERQQSRVKEVIEPAADEPIETTTKPYGTPEQVRDVVVLRNLAERLEIAKMPAVESEWAETLLDIVRNDLVNISQELRQCCMWHVAESEVDLTV